MSITEQFGKSLAELLSSKIIKVYPDFDQGSFVKKSVGNHMTDWLKIEYDAARDVLLRWKKSDNKHTKWIIRLATRKTEIKQVTEYY